MRALLVVPATSLALAACSSHPHANGPSPTDPTHAPTTSSKPDEASGPPLEFVLDPIKRDDDFPPASEQLRGKRAVVLIL